MPFLLLDQNMPHLAVPWLAARLPGWEVMHTFTLGIGRAGDPLVADHAVRLGAIVMTFDEDFLDTRAGLRERLAGVIRLRVWPTQWPIVVDALERLLAEVDATAFAGSAIIVDRSSVRIRPI